MTVILPRRGSITKKLPIKLYKEKIMENYVIAELEIVALATGDVNNVSSPIPGWTPDDNELPIDPAVTITFG